MPLLEFSSQCLDVFTAVVPPLLSGSISLYETKRRSATSLVDVFYSTVIFSFPDGTSG